MARWPAPDSQPRKTVIAGLDIIRFLSACLVMGVHLACASWILDGYVTTPILEREATYPELVPFTWFGWMGVEIFFVISGVVISTSAEGASARSFARSRVLRLYPGAMVCASLTLGAVLVFAPFVNPHPWLSWAVSILLLPVPLWVENVYWTLVVEMAFYALVFGLLWAGAFHRLERLAQGLGGISLLYWLGRMTILPEPAYHGALDNALRLLLVHYGCFFALGMMLYIARRDGLRWGRLLFMAALGVAGLAELAVTAKAHLALYAIVEPVAVPLAVFAVAVVLTMLSLALGDGGRPGLSRWLRRLGMATYPLYLVHQIVGVVVLRLCLDTGMGRHAALVAAAGFCILLAVGVSEFAEPPLRRLLGRAFDRLPGTGWIRRSRLPR